MKAREDEDHPTFSEEEEAFDSEAYEVRLSDTEKERQRKGDFIYLHISKGHDYLQRHMFNRKNMI